MGILVLRVLKEPGDREEEIDWTGTEDRNWDRHEKEKTESD